MHDTPSIASFLEPILIFLAAAVTAVPLFKIAGLGAVIGYLAAGIAIGPSGFSFITDPGTTLEISEFGVVLLLFIIGLELKPSRLVAMRRDIAFLGASQMILTGGIIAAASVPLLGLSRDAAIVAGVALAFASTAIALQLLDERGGMQTQYGRRAFAVLLFQDMAVVPVLALMPLLGPSHALVTNLTDELLSLLHSIAALCFVVFIGRYALNPFFRFLAGTGSREVMVAAALLVVLGAALIMGSAGMSMALGAFLAGVMLSESNFRHQLEADIEPFRGLLMGLFFMSVGMSIDGAVVIANAGLLLVCAIAILPLKALIVFVLLRLTGSTDRGALEAAGALTPAGEFSFVLFPLAATDGLMTLQQAELLSALAALTMFAGPILAKLMSYVLDHHLTPQPVLEAEKIPDDDKHSILVIGFSRFAQIALQVLLAEDMNVTVIDNSVTRIRNAARFGFKVYYGDGTRLDVLRAAGAADAQVIAVCVDRKAAGTIVELAKANFPLARVHARSFDRIHAIELLEKGTDYQIRETYESALMFGGATLEYLLGNPDHVAEVVDFVRQRDEARFEYQLAKGSAEGLKPVPADILPEPLFKPLKKTRALSRESQDIVEGHDVGL
jgi:monovalent cation:proton antiporter-2 (CPA2) family protein